MNWTREDLDRHLATRKSARKNSKQTKDLDAALIADMENEKKVSMKALKREAKERIDRQFAVLCKDAGLPNPITEHRFHETRRWRIDYYFSCKGVRVALEVEGGVHTNGRHTRGAGFMKDMEKYNALAAAGIYLVRTTPSQLFTQGLRDVLAVFENEEE